MDNNYNVIMKWFENLLDKKQWSDYLAGYGYKKIAIYGAGELGKNLNRELNGTEVSVVCFIDKNAERIGHILDKKVYTLDRFFEEKIECDAIVVSVLSADRSVMLDVLKIDPVMPVLSLRDMIYEM